MDHFQRACSQARECRSQRLKEVALKGAGYQQMAFCLHPDDFPLFEPFTGGVPQDAWPSRLRLKLLFLAHFPLEVLLCGPARHYWCFAFERKNMDVKCAVEASNYKDASGSAMMETLSFRQAFAIKFAKNNTMLDEEDSYPAI